MTAPSQPRPPCAQVLADGQMCGRAAAPPGARGMCPACYQRDRRRRLAAAEGREFATYRAGEPQTTITVSLPRSMVAKLDAIAGRRGRSALLRLWIEPHLRG